MPTLSYDYKTISTKVHDILRDKFGPNAAIQTEPGEAGRVFVLIVAEKFNGLSEHAKQDTIWDVLKLELAEESQGVAMVVALGLDQV